MYYSLGKFHKTLSPNVKESEKNSGSLALSGVTPKLNGVYPGQRQ